MFAKQLISAAAASILYSTLGHAAPTSSKLVARDFGGSGVAVWWGAVNNNADLSTVCASPDIDIVVLSFLNHYWAPNSLWPGLNLGSATMQPTQAQIQAGANGLWDGSALSPKIQECQQSGKRVYISLGGTRELATASFKNDDEATAFADNLWNLFLGGVGNSTTDPIRPFGQVVLDGVDLDNENYTPRSYDAFVKKLRNNFSSGSKQFYLSGSPQCVGHSSSFDYTDPSVPITDMSKWYTQGDASIPDYIISQLDDVFVQFYNNMGICSHGDAGFADSVQRWSKMIGGNSKLWIGTPVNYDAAHVGALPIGKVAEEVAQVKAMGLPNLGGYVLWDGTHVLSTKDASGKTYDKIVKEALRGTGTEVTPTAWDAQGNPIV